MAALGFTFDATSVAPRAVESAVRRYFGVATLQDDNDDELQVALKAEAEILAISLLGEPSKRLTNAQQTSAQRERSRNPDHREQGG